MTKSRSQFIAITTVLSLALLESSARAQEDRNHVIVGLGTGYAPATQRAVADSERRCPAGSRLQARTLGDRFYQQRAFDLAAECYRVAAEYNLANLASLRAAKPESEVTARTLATNRDEVTAQVRRLQQAFRAPR
jgi:hypothetical protein